jgi:hypothetical protein
MAGINWLKKTPPELAKARECFQSVMDASRRADEIIVAIRDLYNHLELGHKRFRGNAVGHTR